MAQSVTPAVLAGALTSFRTVFNGAFEAAMSGLAGAWRNIAMEVQSNSAIEQHVWLGTVPQMVDVTSGDFQVEHLYAFDYSITNATWKSYFEVPRSFFEDDKLALVRPKIAQLAQEAARHPGQLLFNLPISNPLAFDGVALIADTRVIGRSANVDNQIAGSGTTVAQFQADLAAAGAQMMLFQDDQGRPMGLQGNWIMVPPALRQTAFQALNANQGAGLVNIVAPPGSVLGAEEGYRIIVNHQLTDANDWFLCHVQDGFSPFIYQTRIPPSLEPLTEGTDAAIRADRFLFGVRARYQVGVGDPRHIVKTTNT